MTNAQKLVRAGLGFYSGLPIMPDSAPRKVKKAKEFTNIKKVVLVSKTDADRYRKAMRKAYLTGEKQTLNITKTVVNL